MQHNRFRQFLVVSIALHLLVAFLFIPILHKQHLEQPVPVMVNLTSAPAGAGSGKSPAALSPPATPSAQQVAPRAPVTAQSVPGAPSTPVMPAVSQPSTAATQKHQPVTSLLSSATVQPLSLHAAGAGVQGTSARADSSTVAERSGSTKGGFVDTTFGSVNGPSFRKQIAPAYPSLARRRGREGVVMIRLMINDAGQLTSIEVVDDPGFGFADPAVEALRASSFHAAHHDGKPVASREILPVRFRLQ